MEIPCRRPSSGVQPLSPRFKACQVDHAAVVSPLAAQGKASLAKSTAGPSPPAAATNQHGQRFSVSGHHRACNPLPSHPGVPTTSSNERSSTCVGTVPLLCRLDTPNLGHMHVRGILVPIGGTASGACRFARLCHATKRLFPIRVCHVQRTIAWWWCYTSLVLHKEDELIC